MIEANEQSPGVLSFVGDAVYTLLMRENLALSTGAFGTVHDLSAKYVSAPQQAAAYLKIEPVLTEREKEIFRRGRNHHTGNVPKSATAGQYHTASGLECLFGYLYLSGEYDRVKQLFAEIIKE